MVRRTYRLTDGQSAALLLLAGKPGGTAPRYHRTWHRLEQAGLVQWTGRPGGLWRLTDEGLAVAERIAGGADA